MTYRFLFFLSLVLFACPLRANDFSAIRLPDESHTEAQTRMHVQRQSDSAIDVSVELSKLKIPKLPKPSVKLEQVFKEIRDRRFLEAVDWAGFPRRISWLFPRDGCWTRAGVTGYLMSSLGYVRPMNIFAFGDLEIETDNLPDGGVAWWFHVATVFADEAGEAAVIDPALEPKRPLSIKEWILQMADKVEDVTISICNEYTSFPYTSCPKGDSPSIDQSNLSGQRQQFLPQEKSNLVELGRDPIKELGDSPPWK